MVEVIHFFKEENKWLGSFRASLLQTLVTHCQELVMSILGTSSLQLFHSLCHTETRTRPTRSQIWILSIARLNCAFDNTDWHAVANCWAALPRRPPSGRIEKNGGMQGEEHLLFLVLTVAGNIEVMGNLFPARARYEPIPAWKWLVFACSRVGWLVCCV